MWSEFGLSKMGAPRSAWRHSAGSTWWPSMSAWWPSGSAMGGPASWLVYLESIIAIPTCGWFQGRVSNPWDPGSTPGSCGRAADLLVLFQRPNCMPSIDTRGFVTWMQNGLSGYHASGDGLIAAREVGATQPSSIHTGPLHNSLNTLLTERWPESHDGVTVSVVRFIWHCLSEHSDSRTFGLW
jgi:hypothetical protein